MLKFIRALFLCMLCLLTGQACAEDIVMLPSDTCIPYDLTQSAPAKGIVESCTYHAYGEEKHALVYLPAGYPDARDAYPVCYFMHGSGQSPERFLSLTEETSLSRLLDHMIASGDLEPMILILPTFYVSSESEKSALFVDDLILSFPEEYRYDLIPALEAHYKTYLSQALERGEALEDAIMATRADRAFAGFSLGSVTTWHVFHQALDTTAYFLPLAGDAWIYGRFGGAYEKEKTAEALESAVKNLPLSQQDFTILAFNGTRDLTYSPMTIMIHALWDRTSVFDHKNLRYTLLTDGRHTTENAMLYLSLGLPGCFSRAPIYP